jgi:hypothetical protein
MSRFEGGGCLRGLASSLQTAIIADHQDLRFLHVLRESGN